MPDYEIDPNEEKRRATYERCLVESNSISTFYADGHILTADHWAISFIVQTLTTKGKARDGFILNVATATLDDGAISAICDAMQHEHCPQDIHWQFLKLGNLSQQGHQTLVAFIKNFQKKLTIHLLYSKDATSADIAYQRNLLLATLASGNGHNLSLSINANFFRHCISDETSHALAIILRSRRLKEFYLYGKPSPLTPSQLFDPQLTIDALRENIGLTGAVIDDCFFRSVGFQPKFLKLTEPIILRNRDVEYKGHLSIEYFHETYIPSFACKDISQIIFDYFYIDDERPVVLDEHSRTAGSALLDQIAGKRRDGFARFYALVEEYQIYDMVFYNCSAVLDAFKRNSCDFFEDMLRTHPLQSDSKTQAVDTIVVSIKHLMRAAGMNATDRQKVFVRLLSMAKRPSYTGYWSKISELQDELASVPDVEDEKKGHGATVSRAPSTSPARRYYGFFSSHQLEQIWQVMLHVMTMIALTCHGYFLSPVTLTLPTNRRP